MLAIAFCSVTILVLTTTMMTLPCITAVELPQGYTSACYNITDKNNNDSSRVCYFTDGTRLDSAAARQYCADRQAVLPIIKDRDTQEAFERFLAALRLLEGDSRQASWIGAHAVPVGGGNGSQWHWINTGRNLSVASEVFSNSSKSSIWIATIYVPPPNGSLLIRETPWAENHNYVCQWNNVTNCSGGMGIYIPADGKPNGTSTIYSVCTREYREKVTWFTAVNRCLEKNASIATFDESGYWASLYGPFWVGLIKSWWTWPDLGDEDMLFNNFIDLNETNSTSGDPASTGIPTQYPNSGYECAVVLDSNWLVKQCNDTFQVVCQLSDSTSPVIPVNTAVSRFTASFEMSVFALLTLVSSIMLHA